RRVASSAMQDSDQPAKLQRARRDELVVEAEDGEAIGRVDSLYYDVETGRPAWIGVRAEGERLRTLVPVEGSRATGEVVRVGFPREVVESAPRIEAEEIDEITERRLVDHYDLPKRPLDERETAVITPIVRYEEALSVTKEREETGRVRVRKWVETEPVTVEVALERETVRVTR